MNRRTFLTGIAAGTTGSIVTTATSAANTTPAENPGDETEDDGSDRPDPASLQPIQTLYIKTENGRTRIRPLAVAPAVTYSTTEYRDRPAHQQDDEYFTRAEADGKWVLFEVDTDGSGSGLVRTPDDVVIPGFLTDEMPTRLGEALPDDATMVRIPGVEKGTQYLGDLDGLRGDIVGADIPAEHWMAIIAAGVDDEHYVQSSVMLPNITEQFGITDPEC